MRFILQISVFNVLRGFRFSGYALLALWLSGDFTLAQTGTMRVAMEISRPVFAISPPGDSNRLFLVEQHTGRIEILDLTTGSILATPFLDIDGLATSNEQGLLGLAFDPDYANNGFFYVNITTSAGSGDTRIRRYSVQGDPATSNLANPNSQFEILSYNQPQANHNGGWIGFSPVDGYLYIASGDGGSGNDSGAGHTAGIGNAQDLTNNLLGKMLRIDVTGDDFLGDVTRNYSIPGDNPFVGEAGDDEIWAYGLRNPYRSSFDRTTGDLWIGDVGQNRKEEIDFQPVNSAGGENYGWRFREGTIATPGGVGGPRSDDPNDPNYTIEPIYDYDQLAQFEPDPDFRGNVVIGGYVYRGPVQAFQGHYFFADSGSNNIWKLDPEAIDPRASVTQVNSQLLPDAGSIQSIGSFGEDDEGNLYMMEVFGGELFRIVTASEDIVWNGDDNSAGAPGDGTTWGNANNWTRGSTVDGPFVDEDQVIFAAGSSESNILLGATRTVSAVTFLAPYTLQNSTLRVLSGNINVEVGVTASLESNLEAESVNHSLRKLGDGTLQVNGTVGQMVVKEGTLEGSGTLAHLTVRDGGTVAARSSGGGLQISNSFTMDSDALLSVDLGGTVTGEFGQLLIAGTTLLDGVLRVKLVDLYEPRAGDLFPLLVSAGGLSGTFDTLDLPTLETFLQWQLMVESTRVTLLVNSTLLGDFNNNGVVDNEDLTDWETGYGLIGDADRADGDADGDADVDGNDFLIWQQQVGMGQSLSTADLSVWQEVAPEPTATGLMAMGLLLSQLGRQGRRGRTI